MRRTAATATACGSGGRENSGALPAGQRHLTSSQACRRRRDRRYHRWEFLEGLRCAPPPPSPLASCDAAEESVQQIQPPPGLALPGVLWNEPAYELVDSDTDFEVIDDEQVCIVPGILALLAWRSWSFS